MTVATIVLLIGFILMTISAFVEPAQVSLYKLAWACFLLFLVLTAGHLTLQG